MKKALLAALFAALSLVANVSAREYLSEYVSPGQTLVFVSSTVNVSTITASVNVSSVTGWNSQDNTIVAGFVENISTHPVAIFVGTSAVTTGYVGDVGASTDSANSNSWRLDVNVTTGSVVGNQLVVQRFPGPFGVSSNAMPLNFGHITYVGPLYFIAGKPWPTMTSTERTPGRVRITLIKIQ